MQLVLIKSQSDWHTTRHSTLAGESATPSSTLAWHPTASSSRKNPVVARSGAPGMLLRVTLASLALCLSVDAFTANLVPAGRAALSRPCHAMRRGMPLVSMSAGEPALASTPVLATSGSAAKTPGYGPHIKIGKSEKILNPWGLWVLTYSMVLALAGWVYLKFRMALAKVLFGLVKGPSPEHCCWIMHKSAPPQPPLPAR